LAEERVERRLAAIMAADVVGYSRLMEAHEERTLGALKQHRREFLEPTVAKHGGRIFKVMGDGFLVEFGSVLNAARCAVELQTGMHDRNTAVPNDRQIRFRIGINVGDIIVDGDDFYGDGVNIASRLEGLAGPGGIACSADVRHQIGNKLEIEFIDQGEKTVKNLAQPVHVYFINLGSPAQDVAVPSGPGKQADGRVSVAVLPFANMAGADEDYFADGLTEDLTMALSKLRFLRVSSRQVMSQYKDASANLQQVGRDLGVQYLVGGAVRKGGNRIRVTAQLIESETASQLWFERFDRELADIFAVQDEINPGDIGPASFQPDRCRRPDQAHCSKRNGL
jgi:adenylate cyclase